MEEEPAALRLASAYSVPCLLTGPAAMLFPDYWLPITVPSGLKSLGVLDTVSCPCAAPLRQAPGFPRTQYLHDLGSSEPPGTDSPQRHVCQPCTEGRYEAADVLSCVGSDTPRRRQRIARGARPALVLRAGSSPRFSNAMDCVVAGKHPRAVISRARRGIIRSDLQVAPTPGHRPGSAVAR